MQSKDCVPSNVEKRKTNSEVPASIERLKYGGVAQQAGGQRFDPAYLHHRFGKTEYRFALVIRESESKHGLVAQVVRAHA